MSQTNKHTELRDQMVNTYNLWKLVLLVLFFFLIFFFSFKKKLWQRITAIFAGWKKLDTCLGYQLQVRLWF